jgi:hypothetical protein
MAQKVKSIKKKSPMKTKKKTIKKNLAIFSWTRRRSAITFAAVFAVIGAIFLWKSFAATAVGTIEAELLTASGTVVTDSGAQGGKALKLINDTAASGTLSTSAPGVSLILRAKGTQCKGAPQVSISIDNSVVLTASVSSSSWNTYTSAVTLPAGYHSVQATFTNPYSFDKGNGPNRCVRELYLDALTVMSGDSNADTTAPTVSLTSPASGSTLSGPVSIIATAQDNVAVSKVEFYIAGKAVSSVSASPYNYAWDTTTVDNGSYQLSAKAYDAAGNVGTSSTLTVTVSNNTTTPPPPTSGSLNQTLGFNTLNTAASDEFSGTAGTKPDSIRWHAKTFTGGSGVYWNGLSNVQLDGAGNLDIFATRQSDGTHWNSSWISGNKSYSGTHYIEARAKMAGGNGPWNGPIWEWDAPYGTQGTENDVNEQLGKEPQAYHTTLHSGGTQSSKANSTPAILANDFHTYAAVVYADYVDYYFDGSKIQTITKSELGGKWGFVETPMVLNINLDMGGWGGTPSTSLPGTVHMLVDYIRVYTP